MNLKSLNLKFLIKAHTKIGLFALFFFYISGFFGTITLFLPQIHTWENPSRYFIKKDSYKFELNDLINRTIQEEGFSSERIDITLPSYRDDVIAINDPNSRTKYINPYTLEMLDTTADRSFLSTFFNDIHIGKNIPMIGQFLMGIAAILALFLTISGIMLFINKHKAKKSFNFSWHRNLSLLLLPYILVFALTGSVLGFMLSSSTPFAFAASETEQTNMRKLVGPIIFPKDKIPTKSNEAKMINIDTLKKKAQSSYKNLVIKEITLFQWYDKNAKIKFSGYLSDNRILTGRVNRQSITLSGTNAQILEKKELTNVHNANIFLSAFYFFHFIPDETLLVRVIYLILGIGFLVSLTLGFLIWSKKEAYKYSNNFLYYNFLSRFAIAIMYGIVPATALILLLYWAIPVELFQRIIWIKGSFYTFWAFSLFLSTYYDDILELIKSLSLFTSIFLFATVITHLMSTSKYISVFVQESSMHTVLYFDLLLLILSILFFLFYKNAQKFKYIREQTKGRL